MKENFTDTTHFCDNLRPFNEVQVKVKRTQRRKFHGKDVRRLKWHEEVKWCVKALTQKVRHCRILRTGASGERRPGRQRALRTARPAHSVTTQSSYWAKHLNTHLQSGEQACVCVLNNPTLVHYEHLNLVHALGHLFTRSLFLLLIYYLLFLCICFKQLLLWFFISFPFPE